MPDDKAFQTRVLQRVAGTFHGIEGPVLADDLEEASGVTTADLDGLACPIRFDAPDAREETLEAAVQREIAGVAALV